MALKAEVLSKRLVIKVYHIEKVEMAQVTEFKGSTLLLRDQFLSGHISDQPLVSNLEVAILKPGQFQKEVPAILDVIPIACKALGKMGEGITHTLTGVCAVLTVADAGGKPPAQIGSSKGLLSEKMFIDRAGTPSKNDHIILLRVTLKEDAIFKRQGIIAAHRVADSYLQVIRNQLKKRDSQAYTEKHVYLDQLEPGKIEVLLIKLLPGQGAMHDFLVLPKEPCGVAGSSSIIDLGNMPVFLTPNEYRDGALRALT